MSHNITGIQRLTPAILFHLSITSAVYQPLDALITYAKLRIRINHHHLYIIASCSLSFSPEDTCNPARPLARERGPARILQAKQVGREMTRLRAR